MMKNKTNILSLSAGLFTLISVGCVPEPKNVVETTDALVIYPDYKDITVPCNIAPLNFMMRDDETDAIELKIADRDGVLRQIRQKGGKMIFDESEWHSIIGSHISDSLYLTVTALQNGVWQEYRTFSWFISPDSIDSYLTYRLIEPGYEVWDRVDIEERCTENFDSRYLAEGRNLDNRCMNCHTHGGVNGEYSFFHVRGAKGGTILNRNGKLRKLGLKTADMTNGSVYGSFHPSGRYAVYTNNYIISSFHSRGNRRLEVYDTTGGMCIADFDENKLVLFDPEARKKGYEPKDLNPKYLLSFPCFSADGEYVYFCATDNPCGDTIPTAQDMLPYVNDSISLYYSLCRVKFNASDFSFGEKVDTVYNARLMGGSANFPKCSPDGKYLMFSISDKGTFPIWHRSTKLAIIDLDKLDEDGSASRDALSILPENGTYHSWSHNSKWLVFASKRVDGQYGRAYFMHVDDVDGLPIASKPLVLPQADPEHDDMNLRSYNIPDFGTTAVPFGHNEVKNLVDNVAAETYMLK